MTSKEDRRHYTPGLCITVYVTVLSVITLLVFPVVIAIVAVSIQSNISKLQLSIEYIKLENKRQPSISVTMETGPESEDDEDDEATRCICQNQLGSGDYDYEKTQSDGLLRCCNTNEENLRKMARLMIREERRRQSQERRPATTSVSIGNIQRLVEDIINRNNTATSQVSPSLSSRPIIPIGIHITGTPEGFTLNRPVRSERSKVKVGPWGSTYGLAFTVHVSIDDHHIIIPKSGTYHVYSQAYFRDEREESERERQQVDEFLHYTVLESTAYAADPINLMKSGRTQEGQESSDYYYSSFHSGLFKLRETDKIYMKVFLPSTNVVLDNRQESTYMGLYMVDEGYDM
ncbi:tumor necrosis factor ligand superfamily member 10-like isoform X1 [Glandiceps talaboti]